MIIRAVLSIDLGFQKELGEGQEGRECGWGTHWRVSGHNAASQMPPWRMETLMQPGACACLLKSFPDLVWNGCVGGIYCY